MRALILGISGQDGSYLSEYLLHHNYDVWGMIRRSSVSENQTSRIDHLLPDINLQYGDMLDPNSLNRIIQECKPDEIYNLAAQSHVRISYDQPTYTLKVITEGTLNLLESIRNLGLSSRTKMYQASSSEMFGNSIDNDGFQRETTPMHPVSPYGCAKLCAYNLCKNYRSAYNMFISNGILFNHESVRRGSNFVTTKVVKTAVEIKLGLAKELVLGNLNACRDWGHAKDYVVAMHLMLEQDYPDDYVCATGKSHSVEYLTKYVFTKLGLKYPRHITEDKKYIRPEELDILRGDPSKAKSIGWTHGYSFEDMLDEMVAHWLEYYENEKNRNLTYQPQ